MIDDPRTQILKASDSEISDARPRARILQGESEARRTVVGSCR